MTSKGCTGCAARAKAIREAFARARQALKDRKAKRNKNRGTSQ